MGTQITHKVGDVLQNGATVLEVDAKGTPVVLTKPKNGNGNGLAGKSVIESAKEAKAEKAKTKVLVAVGKAVIKGATVNAAAVAEKLRVAKASLTSKPQVAAKAERVARVEERKRKNAEAKVRVAAAKAKQKAAKSKPSKVTKAKAKVAAAHSPSSLTAAQVTRAIAMKKDGESSGAIALALGITPKGAWRITNPDKWRAAWKEQWSTVRVSKPARRSKK